MQVFIHAGFHKTGTTSFQNLIRANRSLAPTDVGFLLAHDPLADNLRSALRDFHRNQGPDEVSVLRARLTAILANFKQTGVSKLVISLEVISGLMPDASLGNLYPTGRLALAEICRVFAGQEITLLFSVRGGAAWIRSLHAHQSSKPGFTVRAEEFASAEKFRLLDWSKVIAALTESLPVKTNVSHLEATTNSRLGPASDFLPLFLPPEAIALWQPVARANTGLTPAAVGLSHTRLISKLPDSLRRFLIRQFNSITARI